MSDFESYGYLGQDAFNDDLAKSDDWNTYKRFRFITLFDRANLTRASFVKVWLCGVSFLKANVSHTNFSGTVLSRADFRGVENIEEAVFEGACYDEPYKPLGLDTLLAKGVIHTCH